MTSYPENTFVADTHVYKVTPEGHTEMDDQLAVEEPLEIQLVYYHESQLTTRNIAVTMRTPGQDEELAVGFLFTEGIIQRAGQVLSVVSTGNTVEVSLAADVTPLLQKAERNFYTTSSCGVCGKSSVDAIRTHSLYSNRPDSEQVKAPVFYQLSSALRAQQIVFENTGGLHASALFDLRGNFITLREDVGRHNALDKVIGRMFMSDELPLRETILLLSGRASFELIQKASMAGIKIVAALGAPSSLAVQLAQEFDMTLIGFLRADRFNLYSGSHRVLHKI